MNHNPSISVVLPNYNHAQYIGEAIEAILTQSFRPKELIIVDDGSTDNSISVIKRFAKKDPIVRLLCNEHNHGVVYSMNRALKFASGDYVNFAGADDKIKPGLFEQSINILKKHPYAGLSFSDPSFLDGETGIILDLHFNLSKSPCYFSAKKFACILKKQKTFSIPTNTVLFKRTAIIREKGFNQALLWHCDWFAAFVTAFKYGVCYIPENLGIFRWDLSSYHQAGMRDDTGQNRVLANMLALLNSAEYSDVKDYFKTPSVLSRFGFNILGLIIKNPEYRCYFSIPLVLKTLAIPGERLIRSMIPMPFKLLYRTGRTLYQKIIL